MDIRSQYENIVAMMNDPLETLMGRYRREILGTLLARPDEAFHLRELQRLTDIPVGSLSRELRLLVEGGVLRCERHGRRVEYRADVECPVLPELVALFGASYGNPLPVVRGVAESADAAYHVHRHLKFSQPALARLCRKYHVFRLAVFGSTARGDVGPESDVDVLLEFDAGKAPGVDRLQDVQRELSRVFQGRVVDVATPAVLENPYRRNTILQDMEVLYETRGKRQGVPVGHAPGVS